MRKKHSKSKQTKYSKFIKFDEQNKIYDMKIYARYNMQKIQILLNQKLPGELEMAFTTVKSNGICGSVCKKTTW